MPGGSWPQTTGAAAGSLSPRLSAHCPGLALSLPRLTLQQAWRLPVRPLPWLGPVEASKPARRIALQIHACADVPRALKVGTSAIWRPCRACTCPADRCLLAATCCTLSCARRTMVPLAAAALVPAFWFPHVLHAPDAVLHGQPPWRLPWQLQNSGSSVRAHGCCDRAGYLSCGLGPCTPDIR